MILHITCKTDQFNLSVVGADFMNDRCFFGQDFSNWLVSRLRSAGITADVLCMEDFGWTHTARYQGASYFIGVGGESDMLPDRLNFGIWNIVVEGRRTLMQRLRGIGKLSATGPIISTITHIVTEAGFSDVAIEP